MRSMQDTLCTMPAKMGKSKIRVQPQTKKSQGKIIKHHSTKIKYLNKYADQLREDRTGVNHLLNCHHMGVE